MSEKPKLLKRLRVAFGDVPTAGTVLVVYHRRTGRPTGKVYRVVMVCGRTLHCGVLTPEQFAALPDGTPVLEWQWAPKRPPEPLLPSAAEQRRQRLAAGRVVIVTGGRDYPDRARVFAALDLAHARQPITLLVHGACMDPHTGELRGADRWADEWAAERGVVVERHPADWRTWGPKAGPLRNSQMAQAGAHGCIAFPGGSGTAQMCRQAEHHSIPVWRPFG